MSSLPKFSLPEMFGGQREITSPQPPMSTPNQARKNGKCIPCWEALLPRKQQKECENYSRREGKMVQVARYGKERGCMDCKAIARTRRQEEASKHAEIVRKMGELGLGDDSIEDFEKVAGSSPASKRVVALVKARAKEMAEKEALERETLENKALEKWGAEPKQKENEDEKQKFQPEKEHDAPIEMDIAEAIHSSISARCQTGHPTQLHAVQQEKESTPTVVQNLESELAPEIVTKEHEVIFDIIQELDEELGDEELDNADLEHSISISTSISISKDAEWDLSEENERIWGEVALAPGVTTAKEDEWVVLGSWETGE
ncbi:hypothetical protein EAF04_000633 [Stromatinia cepivora]|nr:hypothetical protein EAF04_000633 [Stromatinia cepivora]